jgi:hypothetical protein
VLASLVHAVVPTSCKTLARVLPGGSDVPESVTAAEVDQALATSQARLEEGDSKRALEWALAAAKARHLSAEERNRVQFWLEQVATRRIEQLAQEEADPKALADVYELDLPRQICVSAGIEAARLWVEQGKLERAFRFLKRIDERYPLHHEVRSASVLLAEIGLRLIEEDSGFLWFSGSKEEGVAVLEYLVLKAPWDERCDEAYYALAGVYEDEEEWALAIERHEDLILYHSESPRRPYSQARVPHLRLAGLESPEYDRKLLTDARTELERWLEKFGGLGIVPPELERGVRIDLTDCLRRLSESDLGIAAFYRRVDNAFGWRFHAERALESAELAGDDRRAARARALISARDEGEQARDPIEAGPQIQDPLEVMEEVKP